jgi:DNA-binding response OmpR family regulator
LRRPPLQTGNLLRMDDLTMDIAQRAVQRAGRTIELSPREFSLLELLLRHPNQVLTRTQILEHVWNFDYYSDTNVVDVYIGYLRRKIDHDFTRPLIQTIRGVGFRLGEIQDD